MDSHRPFNHENIRNQQTIFLFGTEEEEEDASKIPEESDEDSEGYDSGSSTDDESEESESEEEDDSDSGAEDTRKRRRDTNRRRSGDKRQKRRKAGRGMSCVCNCVQYSLYITGSTGMYKLKETESYKLPSAVIAWQLTVRMNKAANELLWY